MLPCEGHSMEYCIMGTDKSLPQGGSNLHFDEGEVEGLNPKPVLLAQHKLVQ